MKIQEVLAERRNRGRPLYRYTPDDHWEQHLHASLGLPWPSQSWSEFWVVWSELLEELKGKGFQPGPATFKAYNDGDTGLVRAIWCLVRLLKPENVVETGVGHGLTSRIILEALQRNGQGHLWSIDLPPRQKVWKEQVGIAVGEKFGDRWTLIKGSSRLRLPGLFAQLGEIDLFIHDSLHSDRNVLFELTHAWAAVKGGGAIVVDDVDVNWALHLFEPTISSHASFICEAEPLRPDLRRFNHKGLFGIILKQRPALTVH